MAFRLATLKLGVPPLAVDLPPDSVLCPEKMISKSSCHLLRMLGKACCMKFSRDDFPAHAVVLAAVAALKASEDAPAAAARAKAAEDAASAAREITAADGKIPARTVPGTAAAGEAVAAVEVGSQQEGDNKCSAEHRHRLRNQAKRFASLTTEPYDLLIPRGSWVVTCFYNHFCCQEKIEEICPGTVEDRKAASAGRKRRRGLQKIGGQNEKEACENEKEASS